MNNSIWALLKIEPTNEIRSIKKAYASQLKTIHPDDHPKEFQALKEAFDQALLIAKNKQALPLQTLEAPHSLFMEDSFAEITREIQPDLALKNRLPFSLALQQFINSECYFYDLIGWQDLLMERFSWSIDEFLVNTYEIQVFLADYYLFISKEILDFLFSSLDLDDLTDELGQGNYVLPQFIAVRATIQQLPIFSFDAIPLIQEKERYNYLKLRYEAYFTLKEQTYNLIWAKEKLAQCLEITTKDADVYGLILLVQLQEEYGLLFNNEEQRIYKQTLATALEHAPSTQTIHFLQNYLTLFDPESPTIGDSIFDWDMKAIIIPKNLCQLLLGQIYFWKTSYSTTYALWSQLPAYQLTATLNQLDMNHEYLTKQQQKELTNLKKPFRNKMSNAEAKLIKKQDHFFYFVIILFILSLVISALGIFQPKQDTNNSLQQKLETTKQVQKIVNQKLQEPIISETPELIDQFIQFFYLDNDYAEKEAFIEEHTNQTGRGLAKGQLEKLLDKDTKQYDDIPSSFTVINNNFKQEEQYTYHLIYMQTELLGIVKTDLFEEKIISIYGDNWEPLSPQQQQETIDFAFHQPEQSLKFFINGFLFESPEARQKNLEEYPLFLTTSMKQILLDKIALVADEELLYHGTIYPADHLYSETFFILPQGNDMAEGLTLTFDDEGRLAHVYGKGWEQPDSSQQTTPDFAQIGQPIEAFYKESWPLVLN